MYAGEVKQALNYGLREVLKREEDKIIGVTKRFNLPLSPLLWHDIPTYFSQLRVLNATSIQTIFSCSFK